MTHVHPATVPATLLFYEALFPRKSFSSKEKLRYKQVHKGFIGEKTLASLLEEASEKVIPLFGALFESDGNEFQIDCIILTSNTVYLIEVKNYSGDYQMKNNQLFNLRTKRQIYNPLSQIERAELLFSRLLKELQINIEVRSYCLFINNNFTLYEAPRQLPIIYPTQVERFLQTMNREAPPLTEHVAQLAQLLNSQIKESSAYEQRPDYCLSELKGGVFCKQCLLPLQRSGHRCFSCRHCEARYSPKEVILYSVAQFHLLFPEEKITTKTIHEWTGQVMSRTFISGFLRRKLRLHRKGKYSYYSFENEDDHIHLLVENYYKKFTLS